MIASHWSGLFSTRECAVLAGVKPSTIRQWRHKGYLAPQGLDEGNRPLHTAQAVRDAEQAARANGIAGNGTDPRTVRGRTPEAA